VTEAASQGESRLSGAASAGRTLQGALAQAREGHKRGPREAASGEMERGVTRNGIGKGRFFRTGGFVVILAAGTALSACSSVGGGNALGGIGETYQSGYVPPPMALEQIPVGSSRDQVLIALGTPSTTAQYGGEVFYYISQTRHRAARFMRPEVVDQRILAVYFDKDSNVERVANYGLQDGKVFDFVSRTTPTGGSDLTFLQQVLSGATTFGNPFGT